MQSLCENNEIMGTLEKTRYLDTVPEGTLKRGLKCELKESL